MVLMALKSGRSILREARVKGRIVAWVRGWRLRKVLQTKDVFAQGVHIKDLARIVKLDQRPGLIKQRRHKAIEARILLINRL